MLISFSSVNYLCLINVLLTNFIIILVNNFSASSVSPRTISKPIQLDNVSDIIDTLLIDYDIRLRPNFGGSALRIGMDLTIASFDSISEVNMDYTITLYLHQYWKDERLAFSKGDYELTLSGDFADKIWVPDTFFANDKNSFLHEVTERNKMVRLRSDGSIAYGMRFTTTLACMMDLHYYPLDSQNCTVEIESYGYTVSDVVMYWSLSPVQGVEQAKLPQFTIIGYETTDRVENLATGTYQRLSLLFSLKRNIGYFIFQTYLPSILIVMLSWVSFWINHEATSARVSLGITTVLTMTTISTGVRSSLPRISYVKAIDIYLVMCFVFVFAALLEYSAVNYAFWSARAKKKPKRTKSRTDLNYINDNSNDNLPSDVKTDFYNQRDEIIELQDVRSSPSLRQRHHLFHHFYHQPVSHQPSYRSSSAQTDDNGSSGQRYPCLKMSNNQIYRISYSPSRTSNSRNKFNYYYARHYQPRGGLTLVSHGSSAVDPGSITPPRGFQSFDSLNRGGGFGFGRRGTKLKVLIPKIKDVNRIDQYSRIVFPVSFLVFNICYWTFYAMF